MARNTNTTVRWAILNCQVQGTLRTVFAFCRNPENDPVFLSPASNVVCQAMANYILGLPSNPPVFKEDRELLAVNPLVIQQILGHLFTEERVFAFTPGHSASRTNESSKVET